MDVVDRTAVIEALSMASSKNVCDLDIAKSAIYDLPTATGKCPLKKYDIVYILKADIDSEELKYSIRSVVENLSYNRIVFYCGCPADLKPDIYVPFEQTGNGKLEKSRSTFSAIMNNDELTEDIWLFNDDFFIMKPLCSEKTICNGTLYSVIQTIESSRTKTSRYTRKLRETALYLQERGLDTISYESHTPMLINRKKAQYILDNFPSTTAFRSSYGNYYGIEGQLRPDIKVSRNEQAFDEDSDLLSTNDKTFAESRIGSFIKSCFPNKSKYEI